MSERKVPNKLMMVVVVGVIVLFVVVLVSKRQPHYSQVSSLPHYGENSKPNDGDSQADTIRALQAYAKEAVGQAQSLNKETRKQQTTVLENRNKVQKLEKANKALESATDKMTQYNTELEKQIHSLQQKITDVEKTQQSSTSGVGEHGIPVGFGFDRLKTKRDNEVGQWHEPMDTKVDTQANNKDHKFTGLLKPPGQTTHTAKPQPKETRKTPVKIEPYYTIPKDSVLFDGVAMTALIGRIPVEGTTDDPYPVKIFVGKENLAANGHTLPDIEGMIFSGLGIGDWNLSCVSARLYSATFIFTDGSIVNHSNDSKPLGYISDNQGWQCVSGIFRTNAPRFLRDRVGLAALGAAGSAYAAAQFSQQRSDLTGSTTSTLTGNIDKVVGGTVIQSATDEVTQWVIERQKQSFDAVIVSPGVSVSVHIEQALPIDHSERLRKIRYPKHTSYSSHTLD